MATVRSHIGKLLKDTLTYGLSNILARLVSVFLTPFYTRVFVPADYGVMSILNSLVSFINILSILGLDNSTARWFYDTDNDADRKLTINTFGWFVLLISTFFGLVLFAFAEPVALYLVGDAGTSDYIRIIAISLPITSWSTVALKVLRYAREVNKAVFISIFSMILTVSLNVVFVLFMHMGLLGVYYALLISSILSLIVSLWSIKKWISFPHIAKKRLKEMLKFSLPLVPGSVSYWITNMSSIYILLFFIDKQQVGLYQIGLSMASILLLITSAFQSAFGPYAFSIIKQENSRHIYAAFFEAYCILMSMAVFLMILFAKDLLVIFTTPAYYSSQITAGILSISLFVASLTEFSSLGMAIAKKTRHIGIGMIIGAVSVLAFSLILTPMAGKEGAALSVLLANSISIAYMFIFSQKEYRIAYPFLRSLIHFISIVVLAYVLDVFLSPCIDNPWTLFAIKSIAAAVVLLILILIHRKKIKRLVGVTQ